MKRYCADRGYDDLGFSRKMREFFEDEYEAVIESKAPRSSLYRLGRQVEYSACRELRAAGFFALRSPASKSPLDVVAVRPGVVLFVQCKRALDLQVSEWNALFDLADKCGATAVLAGRERERGLTYFVLTDRKDGSKRPQPMRRATVAELAGIKARSA